MPVPHPPDASQTDGEPPDPDKTHDTPTPRPVTASKGITAPMTNGDSAFSIPLPPPEAGTYAKEPGHTVCSLERLVLSGADAHLKQESGWTAAESTPSTSPSVSGSEWSAPSTRPPSQAASRAPSMSESVKPPVPKPDQPKTPNIEPQPTLTARRPSVHSDTGGHKFNLKDLLASGPKLARRSSQRSTGSSRKSDSDGERKSTAGDSAASLSKKYGVCQKVAIGKGATSVVRLAHKWDRSEEKLYAVKVSAFGYPEHQHSNFFL
jgi:protein-serine/threonine kinase